MTLSIVLFLASLGVALAGTDEDVCAQFFNLFVAHFDPTNGTCFDHSRGERGDAEQNELGTIAACLFRVHCITRLVGVTDEAMMNSPPPLFNLSTVAAKYKTRIDTAYCSGATTLNQLFQRRVFWLARRLSPSRAAPPAATARADATSCSCFSASSARLRARALLAYDCFVGFSVLA